MEQIDSLADLLDLQAVDLEIDRLLDRRQSLPELDAYKKAANRLARLERDKADLDARIRDIGLDLNKTGGELELLEQKLEAEQNRLYAGGLSARDADYLRQEVEMLGRKKTQMEDQVLELMEERERLEAKAEELEAKLAEARAEKERLEGIITEEWKKIDAEIARKEARKADIVPVIPDDLLDLYEKLREAKDGIAVGRLVEGVCGGCHLRLSAAELVEVRQESPPRCLHCRRILVL